ncbi:MAG: VENN motif pre-toxin domain-containing protein [Acinetobacter sp.]
MGGDKSRAVNAVTMAVTGALGGQTDLQVVANTLAPYAANVIGKEFGHGEDKNTAAQLASHAILGAALAYVNNGNPVAGGSAAVASEAAADYLTNQYKDKKEYQDANGEFQPNLLPENVKNQIRDLTAAIGAVVGGTVGDSAFEAQLAGVVGQNAVENNSLLGDDIRNKAKQGVKWVASKTDIPIAQGVINGIGSVGDGILVLADAFGDSAVSAIHCPVGSSACADAMENNRKKGEAIYQFLTNLDLKEQANKIKQSYADLNSGDPEKVANAQRVQAEVFTSLGVGASFSKTSTVNNKPVAGATSFMTKDDAFYKFASKRSDIDPNGMYDVIAHGAPNKIEVTVNGKAILIDQRTASQLIQKSEGYQKGQPVRLLSCSTGSCDVGFAQNLANKMGVPVQAPTDLVWSYPNGKMVIAPRLSNNPSKPGYNQPNLSKIGEFKIFTPGGNKK